MGRVGGNLVSHLVGFGDYSIRQNSVMQGSMAGVHGKNSSFDATGAARIRIRRRECIGVVNAPADPSAFNSTTLRIQATNSTIAPWGSGIARLFQEYRLKGGVFSFESTFSNYSAAGPLGSVVMATQYNAADRPFQDIDAMLNSAFRTSGNPSENMNHGLECDPELQGAEYLKCRNNANDWSTQAPNNYDFGNFTIATIGLPDACANAQVGRLYFTYDLELAMPRVADPLFSSRYREISTFMVSKAGMCGPGAGLVPLPSADDWTVQPRNFYYTPDASSASTPSNCQKSGAQFIGNCWGGCVAHDGQELSLAPAYNNQMALGNPPNPDEIVLFPPDTTGENQTWYEPGPLPNASRGQMVWVCGTPLMNDPDLGTAVTFNFRHGGWYEFTWTCPGAIWGMFPRIYDPDNTGAAAGWNCIVRNWFASEAPFYQGDEIPPYTTEGADTQYTHVLSNAPVETFTPKGTTLPPKFAKIFGTDGFPLEIRWRIKFNSSAPSRSIRFAGVRPPQEAAGPAPEEKCPDLYYFTEPDLQITPGTGAWTTSNGTPLPQWSIRFLGDDLTTGD